MGLVDFSSADLMVLREMVDLYRRSPRNPPTRLGTNPLDVQFPLAPELYVAKPQEVTGIPGITDEDTSEPIPGTALCDIYQIRKGSGSDLVLLKVLENQRVYNIGGSVDQEFIAVARTKFGKWIALVAGTGESIVGGMLAENHPGRGIPFLIWLGTWCPIEAKWRYECSGGDTYYAIDWRHDVPEPLIYAQGLFVQRTYTPAGTGSGTGTGTTSPVSTSVIYETVSLDCTSDGICSPDHVLPCTGS